MATGLASLHVPSDVAITDAFDETTLRNNSCKLNSLQSTRESTSTRNYYLNETDNAILPAKQHFYSNIQRRYQICGKER